MMKTEWIPSIFASSIAPSQEGVSPIFQVPPFTADMMLGGKSAGNDAIVMVNCTAVATATPTAEPSARNQFLVEVVTASSDFLASACNATRAVGGVNGCDNLYCSGKAHMAGRRILHPPLQ